jgi:hypothetical protein
MISNTQGDSGGIFIALFLVVFAVSYRIAAYFIDKGRITKYFRRKYGEVNYISWEPFGPGWLGDNLNRIYRVGYVDENGDSNRVFVKISLLAGLHIVKF